MKANELRVGNYFQWIKIASMGIGKDVITKDNHYTYEDFKEPIPLTEEWLVRFGWVKSKEQNYFWEDNNFTILFDDSGFYIESFIGKLRIKYVHSLQNLYHALTGEDLTITK